MRDLFWNCRGISKKGFSPYIRDTIKDHKFDFLCFQETMVEDFSNSCFMLVDLGNEYLRDWSPAIGKSKNKVSSLLS
jgi:exonuclease III